MKVYFATLLEKNCRLLLNGIFVHIIKKKQKYEFLDTRVFYTFYKQQKCLRNNG